MKDKIEKLETLKAKADKKGDDRLSKSLKAKIEALSNDKTVTK